MEYVTGSQGTEVVLLPAPLLFLGCLFPCPLAPWPASSYLLSVAHWSLMHLLLKGLGPCTATLQPSAYPVTVETWAQVRIRNAAWAAAILSPSWQSHGFLTEQLGRLELLRIHNLGTDHSA